MESHVDHIKEILKRMAEVIYQKQVYLNELDRQIGDGEHGYSMNRGFQAVLKKLPDYQDQSVGSLLRDTGMTLMSVIGGASGAIYGSAFMNAAKPVMDKQTLEFHDIAGMFNAALDAVYQRGKVKVGDKTIADTLAPVVDYLHHTKLEDCLTTADLPSILEGMVSAAKRGMESTKDMKASKGRASFLGERSKGHLDPGAVSCYLLIKAIKDYFESVAAS